ncbi:hypothetical protein [Natrinema marinum]|uniref:hypothetical protein n=1 Tax=Natrinema marinum TaxID=2961598 RepID=UPI0020C8C6A6|nr:hypothetical protein [Natrinema marinum]
MDEDTVRTGDGAETDTIQWRRDTSTSRTVRLLWMFGVGTFFAAIGTVICWRLYRLGGEAFGAIGRTAVLALIAAFAATIIALAVAGDPEGHLARISGPLPFDAPTGTSADRAVDAAVGTVAMGAIIGVLMGVGRYVSQNELLAVGAGPFTGLAALFLPIGLVALVLASFLQSVGTLDAEEGAIYLYEPDQRIDLEVITDVSIRRLGDAAILKLDYAQPGGQYVQGPRRIVVPPAVARDVAALVRSQT